MGSSHDQGVTRKRLAVENALDKGYWDDVFTEREYYENSEAPVGEHPQPKGNPRGEFDVLAVNYRDRVALYVEVKSTRGDLYKADKQLKRAEKHFEDTEWDVIGQTWLENK